MEILFYGNGKRMIKYYSLIIICLLILSGLNLYYFPSFNLLMLVVLILILIYSAFVVNLVLEKFIESGLNDLFSTEFNRIRTFTFLGVFVMIYILLKLLQEPTLSINGFNLAYIQKSISIIGLVVCFALTEVICKTITIHFNQINNDSINLNSIEINKFDNKRETLNILYYCLEKKIKETKKGIGEIFVSSKRNYNVEQEYIIAEDKLNILYNSLRKYAIIKDCVFYDFFKNSFLKAPIVVNMNYSDLYLFYKLFIEKYSIKISMKKFCTFFLRNNSCVFDYATFRKEGNRQTEPKKKKVLEEIFEN